jgi:hypothetical protein
MPEHEAFWRDVQRGTAALSPKGRLEVVKSGPFSRFDRPDTVIAAVQVAAEGGTDVSACRRLWSLPSRVSAPRAPRAR